MKEVKETVEMTAEERKEYEEFLAFRERQKQEEKAKADRVVYRTMVDDELERSLPKLKEVSNYLLDKKKEVLDSFKAIIDMKTENLKLTKDDQRSHTFTNSAGNKRITIGVYVTDGYLDTVEEGIAIVKECIEGLADENTRPLVKMVLRLLSRDAKGTLKASRIVQLRKIAEEMGNERFLEGVRIIEEAYLPAISKQFIRVEEKTEHGAWKIIPLNITEV